MGPRGWVQELSLEGQMNKAGIDEVSPQRAERSRAPLRYHWNQSDYFNNVE